MELDLRVGDAKDVLKEMADTGVQADMCLVSVPYGSIRGYRGFSFDPNAIYSQLVKVLKPQSVFCLNIADQCQNHDYSGESFRQVLFLKSLGMSLNQTIILNKNAFPYPI